MATSSQKFIQRNRAPRVQIEYDVELYGAEKKVQLPFVMGVMSDLSGNPAEPLAPVADRKFVDISVDNFDDRLKAMKPRVAVQVPNTLTGEGNLSVDLSFESLDDFSPAAIARKVGALNQLLQARNQLSNLVTYMDGRTGAEDLIANLLRDPTLLQTLAAAPKPDAGGEGAAGQDKPKDK
jgi:type VI secretion system protein ImpB